MLLLILDRQQRVITILKTKSIKVNGNNTILIIIIYIFPYYIDITGISYMEGL